MPVRRIMKDYFGTIGFGCRFTLIFNVSWKLTTIYFETSNQLPICINNRSQLDYLSAICPMSILYFWGKTVSQVVMVKLNM